MSTSIKCGIHNIPIKTKVIKLSEGYSSFPDELFAFKDTLEILDLSKNNLSSLPNEFKEFKKLKIAFFSENNFEVFPEVLAECHSLTMVGFKSNRIKSIPENAFPKSLRWLILTDNQLTKIPDSIGDCYKLQKCAIAGNQLKTLPESMRNCINLELLRVSANLLDEVPSWLVELPSLSWLAIDGNPYISNRFLNEQSLENVVFEELTINNKIGEGASGFIYKANWSSKEKLVALKIFKGNVTSDGYPKDELENCLLIGRHKNIVPLIGPVISHPDKKAGIVMDFIPDSFKTLGLPPNFDTCTRDVFIEDLKLTAKQTFQIAYSIANGACHLHQKGVMHGDLYAHNIMYHQETGEAYLGDFGASTYYETSSRFAPYFERLDGCAYGCLLDDLISICFEKNEITQRLGEIRDLCLNKKVLDRPSFEEIISFLTVI
jgi:hypothetical protein